MRDGDAGIVLRHAEAIEHHHRVGHRRINAAEPVLAIEPLAHEGDGGVDRALPPALGEERIGVAQQIVDGVEHRRPDRALGARRRGLRARREELADGDVVRIARARPPRHQHQERHQHGARPVRDLGEMEREPARQQRDLNRHHRHRAPRQLAEERELDAGKDIAPRGAALRQDRRARPRHVRRIGRVARRLQREIGLDARREIERAAMKERPAAMRALDGAEILRERRLGRRVDLAEIMPEQDVLGRDRRVGLEREGPFAVALLEGHEGIGRARHRPVEGARGPRRPGPLHQGARNRRGRPGLRVNRPYGTAI